VRSDSSHKQNVQRLSGLCLSESFTRVFIPSADQNSTALENSR
jgi:hypothetical protein